MFNPQALQDPGFGGAASLLGTGIGSLTNRMNQESQNKNAMLQALLNNVGATGRTMIEQNASTKRTEMGLPQQFASQSNTYYELAKKAEDAGMYEQAAAFRAQGDQLSGQSYKLLGGAPGQGTVGQPQGGTTIQGMTPSITGQPVQPAKPQGLTPEEAAMPSLGQSQPIPNIPNISTTGQTNLAQLTKAKEEAAKAGIQLSSLQSYDQVLSAPDNVKVKGAGGIEYQGITLNPVVRSILETKKQQLGVDPKGFVDARIRTKDNAGALLNMFSQLDNIQKSVTSDPKTQIYNRMAGLDVGIGKDKEGQGGLGVSGLSLLKLVPGANKKQLSTLAGSIAANKQLEGYVSNLARNVSNEVGNLSSGDVERAKGLVGSLYEDPEIFKKKQIELAQSALPKLMEDALAVGDAYTFNKLQKRYSQIVGTDYTPGQEVSGSAQAQSFFSTPSVKNIQPAPAPIQLPSSGFQQGQALDLSRIAPMIRRGR